MFLRDAKQAEVLLNQQETFLSKEDVPVSSLCFPNNNLSKGFAHLADRLVSFGQKKTGCHTQT